MVIAKPSDPRGALVKSTPTPSASSTTKGSSSTAKSSQKKSKTPTDPTVELTEKTAVEPPAGPPAWHCGWLIAGVLIAIFVVVLIIMIVFVAAKGMDDAEDKARWAKEDRDSSSPNQRRIRDTQMVSGRVKFRLREPPDPL
ncbi:hypothetical protein PRIPAC_70164 [Pristionchus pacificus]|nr:hypothetical protein PRIPAC_70164 [Pristionchus pacificus]